MPLHMRKQHVFTRRGEQLLSRRAVADRWGVSTETVKRREADGLVPVRFNSRLLRYKLSQVQQFEETL